MPLALVPSSFLSRLDLWNLNLWQTSQQGYCCLLCLQKHHHCVLSQTHLLPSLCLWEGRDPLLPPCPSALASLESKLTDWLWKAILMHKNWISNMRIDLFDMWIRRMVASCGQNGGSKIICSYSIIVNTPLSPVLTLSSSLFLTSLFKS